MKLIETAMGGGTTNSKPPGSIIMIGQSETVSSTQIIFITFCSRFTAVIPGSALYAHMMGQKHFLEPYPHVLTFLHPILMCRSHNGHSWDTLSASPPTLGLERLRATHSDQSNYLANQKQGAGNKYDWTVSAVFQAPSSLPGDSLHSTHEPHPRFPVQGCILSVSGDALRSYVLSSLII
jgi:hypothetical protein